MLELKQLTKYYMYGKKNLPKILPLDQLEPHPFELVEKRKLVSFKLELIMIKVLQ